MAVGHRPPHSTPAQLPLHSMGEARGRAPCISTGVVHGAASAHTHHPGARPAKGSGTTLAGKVTRRGVRTTRGWLGSWGWPWGGAKSGDTQSGFTARLRAGLTDGLSDQFIRTNGLLCWPPTEHAGCGSERRPRRRRRLLSQIWF